MDNLYCARTAQELIKKLWRDAAVNAFDPNDANRPVYSIDTPPPTVSGNLHIGHVFSYTHTDFLARYRRMRGYNVFYPMGFDDNGLPTERYVEKKHKTKAHVVGRSAFIKLCLEEVGHAHEAFGALWQELGLSIDWRFTYSTISDLARRVAQQNFLDMLTKNQVYRTATAALYCTTCQTSVAQAELDSMECKTTFNTILFTDKAGTTYPIATTRPELLPACVAVLYHPDDARFTHLAGQTLSSPFFNTSVPCIADGDVLPDKGTGLVMCCTFGDQTDITWFERHQLPLKSVMDERGIWLEHTGPMAGLRAPEARAAIITTLKAHGLLIEEKQLVHAVNVHERCKQPIEYRVIPQWFVRIMENKELFLENGEAIAWFPSFMHSRYKDWVTNLGWDWCISRQRFYGVPFPVWHCLDCSKVLTAPESCLPIDPTETNFPGGACSCGSTNLRGETDVMDTWNISSLTPQINIANLIEKVGCSSVTLPFSLRPQAHDIIRTWAFDTIVKSTYDANTIPWRSIVISGHVTQGSGKISKSTGGAALTPQSLLESFSPDAIRYWAGKASPGVDTAFSEEQIKIGLRLQTKLWNAFRFIEQQVPANARRLKAERPKDTINAWITDRCTQTTYAYSLYFEAAEYARALDSVDQYFWHDFCDNYLELIKDRFFNPHKYTAAELTATHETLYTVGYHILQLYAPFIPFVTDYLYQQLYRTPEGSASIHTTQITVPTAAPERETATEQVIAQILHIVGEVRRQKSENHVSLKTPLSSLTLIVAATEAQTTLMAESATITGITKAQAMDVQIKESHPGHLCGVSMVLAPQDAVEKTS
ncbi:MAG: valyl-tRNA synthetase [Candidatus Dependentiae bacterium]|nr:valyl-tRNA synthetase [Candidatus Dependentiae bacterium]